MTKNFLIILGVLLLFIVTNSPIANSQIEKPIFKYGINSSPETLDPAQAWDSTSIAIIDQVMEGLIAYDLFDPELTLVPRLAIDLGTWNEEVTEVTFKLRQDVTFHDGVSFNASAVKNTFDRLNYLIEHDISQIAELYEPLGKLYLEAPLLINKTVELNEFTIKFVLNYPYAAFISLLCFSGSYIVHPSTPFDHLIELNETLIGTGPYMLDYYIKEETHFVAYQNYYRSQPDIQEMLWIFYDDSIALAQALVLGDVDMVDSFIDVCWCCGCDMRYIHIDPPKPSANIYYLGMNNKIINKTFRQAISYAIDYNYIIVNIMGNQAIRMKSVIPEGILYHDPTVESAQYNLTVARQILVEAGLSEGLSTTSPDLDWYNLSETNPIATFNYSYNTGNRVRGDIGLLIKMNLRYIGIRILLDGLNWSDYLFRLECDFDKLQLYQIGWHPDYNDPSNYCNPLFSNISSSNNAQVDDPWLQSTIMDALTMTNETERREMYAAIQHYIAEDLMPWVFLYTPISKAWWSINLTNYPRNVMGKRYFCPCTWYSTPTTTSNTTNSTTDSDTGLFVSGNIPVILLSLFCVPIVLIYRDRKKSPLNCP